MQEFFLSKEINLGQLAFEVQAALGFPSPVGVAKTGDTLFVYLDAPTTLQISKLEQAVADHAPNPFWKPPVTKGSPLANWSAIPWASLTPDQAATWIDNNVKDLASAKTVLKAMASAILVLAKLAKLEK